MKLLRKIFKKVCFELKMLWMDFNWWRKEDKIKEPFAPSFYYKNSPETIKEAWRKLQEQREKEYREIMEMIEAHRRKRSASEANQADTKENN